MKFYIQTSTYRYSYEKNRLLNAYTVVRNKVKWLSSVHEQMFSPQIIYENVLGQKRH